MYPELLNKLEKFHITHISELHKICLVCEISIKIYDLLENNVVSLILEPHHEFFPDIKKVFVKKLRSFIDPDGVIHYERHPKIKPLYLKLNQLDEDLRRSISHILKEADYRDTLQNDQYDIINDHYVLAIKSDHFRAGLGKIIAKSSTGSTLYVEPFSIRNKSNQRLLLSSQIDVIIESIIKDFCSLLRPYLHTIKSMNGFLSYIDFNISKTIFSSENNLVKPLVNNQNETFISNLFHPLIEDPVCNDIEIPSDKSGLIISGPNTGGKTVTLKALSLSYLFLHYGLFIPATDGNISIPDGVYYFASDHQNISSGLSSFSSESTYYLNLLGELERNSFIFIDEIFNSTSSDEASALAIALLDEIQSRGDHKVIISTHHQMFKTMIHDNHNYLSAHVGYDIETELPTYKLHIGSPGSSMALDIFKHIEKKLLGTDRLTSFSQKYLNDKYLKYDKLLQSLSNEKEKLRKLANENSLLNSELKNQRQSMLGVLFLEKQKLLKVYEGKLKTISNKAEILFSKVKVKDIGKKNFQNNLGKIQADISSSLEKDADRITQNTHNSSIAFENINLNSKYFSNLLKSEVVIYSINNRKKSITVLYNGKKIECPYIDLKLSNSKSAYIKEVQINYFLRGEVSTEIDCRGMRLDEFENLINKSIAHLYDSSIPYLTIIHGHGDGILKNWLRSFLDDIKEVSWHADEGNDGCTTIKTN